MFATFCHLLISLRIVHEIWKKWLLKSHHHLVLFPRDIPTDLGGSSHGCRVIREKLELLCYAYEFLTMETSIPPTVPRKQHPAPPGTTRHHPAPPRGKPHRFTPSPTAATAATAPHGAGASTSARPRHPRWRRRATAARRPGPWRPLGPWPRGPRPRGWRAWPPPGWRWVEWHGSRKII